MKTKCSDRSKDFALRLKKKIQGSKVYKDQKSLYDPCITVLDDVMNDKTDITKHPVHYDDEDKFMYSVYIVHECVFKLPDDTPEQHALMMECIKHVLP